MKRRYLLLVFCLTTVFTQAQSWCPPGATWHYDEHSSIVGVDGVVEFNYVGDITVNSIQCKKIVGTFRGKKIGYNVSNTVISNYKTYVTYENNGVLYLYNGSTFDTVVNFNAHIGDKWLTIAINNSGICTGNRHALTVTDTGHIWINNVYLKKIITNAGVSIERLLLHLSAVHGSVDMFSYDCELKPNVLPEFPFVNFRCYKDNSFPLYSTYQFSCDNLTGIKTLSESKNALILFPNPASDVLKIANLSGLNVTIKVFDLLGNILLESDVFQSDKMEIQLTTFSKGVYFVKMFERGNLLVSCKFIKA